MRADIAAAVALNAGLRIPDRHSCRDPALFISRKTHVHDAVLVFHELADREIVTLLLIQRFQDLCDDSRDVPLCLRKIRGIRPALRNLHESRCLDPCVDRCEVLSYDILALRKIGLLSRCLHISDRFLHRNDRHEFEEGCLKDHIKVTAESQLLGNFRRVDRIEADLSFCNFSFRRRRKMSVELLSAPRAVDEQGAAGLYFRGNVILLDIGRVMTCDEISGFYIIGRADRPVPETQMALRDPERFLGVVLKVGLREFARVRIDDLDRIFVRADSSVGSESPELAADHPGILRVDLFIFRERQVRHIIDDTDREAVDRILPAEIRIDRCDLGRRCILGGQTVSSSDHRKVSTAAQSSAHIEVERIAGTAHLLGPIKNGNRFHRLRKGCDKALHIERPVEVDLYEADLLSARVQVIDRLLYAA